MSPETVAAVATWNLCGVFVYIALMGCLWVDVRANPTPTRTASFTWKDNFTFCVVVFLAIFIWPVILLLLLVATLKDGQAF